MAVFMVVSVVFSCVLVLLTALLRWNEVRYNKKGVPPGTMGWPFFGETADFLKQGPSFMNNQSARFGTIFKTHILGNPTIISMDTEVNRQILLTSESNGIVPGYPSSMQEILGTSNIMHVLGTTHKNIRGTLLSIVNSAMIKDHILPSLDDFMRNYLPTWTGQVIDFQQHSKQMAFLYTLKLVFADEWNSISDYVMPELLLLGNGTIGLPIDLPGTAYRRGLQARKNIVEVFTKIMEERRGSNKTHHDMLGFIMKEEEKKPQLTDGETLDLVFAVLYSGFETMSTTSMMAIKCLHDHPHALDELRKEHFAIRARKNADDPIDYEDFKSMTFTKAVILETLRLCGIVNGEMRKTTKDMKLNGFLIPEGWRIYVYTRELNFDKSLYPDGHTFNPWRWLDKSLESQRNFLMFGGGARLCPGKEFGLAEVSAFLHYFVTGYRWEEVGVNKLVKFPRVIAPNGLHYRVSSY